jgi:uncharacterized protein (DUF58 family)
MSRQLPSELRRALGHSRLIALRAPANAALGERRSRSVGGGLEFAQYKEYEPGDDIRHLDRHVYARHGKTVVRQFHLEQRLRVNVLLDASGSMAVDPGTWDRAVDVAAVFGEAALNGSDQVRFGVAVGDGVLWGQVVSRDTQLRREVARLAAVEPSGRIGSLAELASRSLEALGQPGLLVVVSDWLVECFAEALRTWRVRSQEVVAVQVLGEAEAAGLGASGSLRLVDAESGEILERQVDHGTWRAYKAAVEAWGERVRAAVWAVEGRWVSTAVTEPLDAGFVTDLRRQGLIT